jgi:alpha-tubulin suppressor-like RCC1 family protein
VTDVEVGASFGAVIDSRGMVWTWGSNASGELGVGDYEPRASPFPVVAL